MIGLVVFTVLGIYIVICLMITKFIAKRISNPKIQLGVRALLPLILLLPPFADELIGKVQYDKLCREAEDVKIYGTIPVGEELYFPDGKWRRSSSGPLLSLDESNRIESIYKSLIEYQDAKARIISAAIPIRAREVSIVSRQDGRLLASMQWYATSGGWLSRHFENPLFVDAQCHSSLFGEKLSQKILPFNKTK
ncbi:MAG: hypothetical protein V4568_10650 [Pseudomonadota bacterium]